MRRRLPAPICCGARTNSCIEPSRKAATASARKSRRAASAIFGGRGIEAGLLGFPLRRLLWLAPAFVERHQLCHVIAEPPVVVAVELLLRRFGCEQCALGLRVAASLEQRLAEAE